MPEMIKCSQCNAPLRVPEHLLGKEVSCPSCQTVFTASVRAESDSEAQQLAQPEDATADQQRVTDRPQRPNRHDEPDDDFEDEDHPRRPRRRDHYPYGDRSGMVLAFGIVSTVFILFSCVFALVLGIIPVGIIGVGTGAAAWILGRKDLAAMETGDRDPRGQAMTNAGMICGMIGTIVNGLIVVLQCGLVLVAAIVWALAAAGK
jgi:hypothetical protein